MLFKNILAEGQMGEFIGTGTCNVYEDLGFPDPESMKMKPEIVNAISGQGAETHIAKKWWRILPAFRHAGFFKLSTVNFAGQAHHGCFLVRLCLV